MSVEKNLKYNRGGYLVYYYRILKHIIDACIYDTDGLVNFKEFLRVKVNEYNASANAEKTTSTSVTSKEPIEDFEAFCQEVFSLDLETATRGMKKYFKKPGLGIFMVVRSSKTLKRHASNLGQIGPSFSLILQRMSMNVYVKPLVF